LTLATEDRARHFTARNIVTWCLEELERRAEASEFEVLAYVFMPDHLHLLVAGTSDTSRLPDFVKSFKQRTGYWFRQRWHQSLCQKSYYDHVLRRDEDLAVVAEYLAANPLNAGLVKDWQKYPFWGGRLLVALANEGGAPSNDEPSSADLKVAATSLGRVKGRP
jgi:putative transposase